MQEISIYEALEKSLKNMDKTMNDIQYIVLDYCEDLQYSLVVEDFLQIARNHDVYSLDTTIKIVGNGWFLSTDEDDVESFSFDGDNYFFARVMPSKPEKELNLTKELLIDGNALYNYRILFDDEE